MRLVPLLAAFASLWLPYQSNGDTITLRAGEDQYNGFRYVQATSDTIRYTREEIPIFFGQMGPGNHNYARGFFYFDLAPLKNKASGQPIKVNSVTLTLFKTAGPAVPTTLDLRVFGDGSKQYDLTDSGDDVQNWADAPKEPGGSPGSLLIQADNPVEANITITFENSTAFVEAVRAALEGDGVLRLMGLWEGDQPESAPLGERMTRFQGASAMEVEQRPTLTIHYSANP